MMAPLMDNRGKVRYFIGSQVDVSGLAKQCTDLPALKRMLAKEGEMDLDDGEEIPEEQEKDEFQALSEMFNQGEIEMVRKTGGRMHKEHVEDDDTTSVYHQPRLLIKDTSPPLGARSEVFGKVKNNGKLVGIYSHVSQQETCAQFQELMPANSTFLSGRTLLSASSSPRLRFAYQESSSRPLWTGSAAARGCVKN